MSSFAASSVAIESAENEESSAAEESLENNGTLPPSQTKKTMLEFRDHYSLGCSTELRFRGKKDQKVVVLDSLASGKQFVMIMKEGANEDKPEERKPTSIEPGVYSRASFGANVLRAVMAGVSFFVLSVWYAFSIQCIFFLFMNVVGTYTPSEWTANPPIANMVGCILTCPVLVDSLAKTLTMSLACTVDCWRGIATHPSSLWKNIGRLTGEWLILAVFFGVPTLTFVVSTIVTKERALDGNATQIQDDNVRDFHELTMLSWFLSVLVFQIIYMELCIFNEVVACQKLLVHFRNTTSILQSIKTNLILTQRQKYSGIRRERYLVQNLDGDDDPSHLCGNRTSFTLDNHRKPVQSRYTLGTRLTKLLICFYDNIEVKKSFSDDEGEEEDQPTEKTTDLGSKVKRNYTIDEIFGNVRIVTNANWSLEKLWCSNPKKVSSITVLSGKASVTQRQFLSGYLCVAAAMALIVAAVAAFLIWVDKSLTMIIVVTVFIVAFCFFPMIVSLYKMGQHQKRKRKRLYGDEEETPDDHAWGSDVIVSVWESVRVTELKEWACFASAAFEIFAFFLWPLGSLFYFENTDIGIVFAVLGIHMIPRHYFNPSSLLQDSGPIDNLDMSELDFSLCPCTSRRDEEEKRKRNIKNKMLISNLIARVTTGTVKRAMRFAMLFAFFIFFVAYWYAASTEAFSVSDGFVAGKYKWKSIILADGFEWEAQPQLQYPTCTVGKGFNLPGGEAVSIADYSFLGLMSFASPDESQPLLNQWFGNETVDDDFKYVDNYRKSVGLENHPVEFKLFTIAGDNTSAVVAIRGSEARWDWLVDIQLWMGGVLAQMIKNVNPLGNLWDPILDEVVFLINLVQSNKLKEVSYYRFTSEFIETLYNGFEGRQYENLRVTGVSLGGGLSILTGAITGASAISFSGLNAMFSRRTFLPPITEEQLNTRVFNTIPQRDIIANFDKPGLLYQKIQCTAPKQDWLMGCHSMFRTNCELQYKCGSRGRPINCKCVSQYGYPKPTQVGDVTWEEACSKESTAPGIE